MIHRCVFSVLILWITASSAWTTPRSTQARGTHHHVSALFSSPKDVNEQQPITQSRRQWMYNAAALAATPFVLASSAASATEPTITTMRPIVTTAAVCDRTVSVWREPNRNRLVYVLGTAHISKLSADLAGTLVRRSHQYRKRHRLQPS
jgi:hypothetical protein